MGVNNLNPSVCNVGHLGEGTYVCKYNGKHTINYLKWRSMLVRCYGSSRYLPTYENCVVCDDWLNFQVFSEWFYNTYPTNGLKYELDKDILSGNITNKRYSPETCCWVPHNLNKILTCRTNDRGDEPLGVRENKSGNYSARINRNGVSVQIGTFTSRYLAFRAYKVEKERYIREEAERLKHILDTRAYEALISYQVLDDSKWLAHLHI